tara:strand:+ start:129 stop:494 length:366 start_codon:yes stop_codon:yes gene_type:complete
MKIEIELHEIEKLKAKIKSLYVDNCNLKDKLKSLDEDKLRKDALDLAAHIFSSSVNRVFLELGFKDSEVWQPVNFAEFERILGVNWYSCERMQIDLGVEITSEMRRAFLRMGIQSECSAIK